MSLTPRLGKRGRFSKVSMGHLKKSRLLHQDTLQEIHKVRKGFEESRVPRKGHGIFDKDSNEKAEVMKGR